MKTIALLVLVLGLVACGPSVEVTASGSTNPRPRPVGCAAGPAPKIASIERNVLSPAPAAAAAIALDPKANRALIIGGLSSSGVYAKRVSVLDLASLEHRVLTVEGDEVKLPALAASIWDPENERAIVLGGTAGGPDLEQAFAVRVEGDRAIVDRLPDFPLGSVFSPAIAYDPIGKRLIVVAYVHAIDDDAMELAYRATVALDLRAGVEGWSTLLPGESGPPQPALGETREMAYDPARDQMILVGSGTKSALGQAWVLDLQKPEKWIGLAGTFPASPVSTPSLVRDAASCSFLYFTRMKAACGFDAWNIDAAAPALASNPLGAAPFEPGGPGYGFVLNDSPRDRLMILGGGDCSVSDIFLDTVEIVGLER